MAADLLRYHRREARPAWWAFFERLERSSGGALRRGHARRSAASSSSPTHRVVEDKQSLVYELRFPPQQHKIGPGPAVDPASGKRGAGRRASTTSAGVLWVKRAQALDDEPLPRP